MTGTQSKRTEKPKMGRVETIARTLMKTVGRNPDKKQLGYSPISGEVDGDGKEGTWYYEWRLYERPAQEALLRTLRFNDHLSSPALPADLDDEIPF